MYIHTYVYLILALMVHVLYWYGFGEVYDNRSVYCLCFNSEKCVGIAS